MSRFVKVRDDVGDELLLNVESIAWVHVASRTVCTSGVSGEENGLLYLASGETERLVALIGGDDGTD